MLDRHGTHFSNFSLPNSRPQKSATEREWNGIFNFQGSHTLQDREWPCRFEIQAYGSSQVNIHVSFETIELAMICELHMRQPYWCLGRQHVISPRNKSEQFEKCVVSNCCCSFTSNHQSRIKRVKAVFPNTAQVKEVTSTRPQQQQQQYYYYYNDTTTLLAESFEGKSICIEENKGVKSISLKHNQENTIMPVPIAGCLKEKT